MQVHAWHGKLKELDVALRSMATFVDNQFGLYAWSRTSGARKVLTQGMQIIQTMAMDYEVIDCGGKGCCGPKVYAALLIHFGIINKSVSHQEVPLLCMTYLLVLYNTSYTRYNHVQ